MPVQHVEQHRELIHHRDHQDMQEVRACNVGTCHDTCNLATRYFQCSQNCWPCKSPENYGILFLGLNNGVHQLGTNGYPNIG